jgi:hypothetical protein
MKRLSAAYAAVFAIISVCPAAFAGVAYSTYADGPTWNGTPTIQTTATPQATMTVNNQQGAGQSFAHTFKTGASGFKLDMIDIYSGGKAGADLRLNIYTDPVGGDTADGFVNTSFSSDLLGGGAGIPVTVFGSPGLQYIRFDLTGADEITLAPNQQYAFEIDVLSGQMSWQRGAEVYADGNFYTGGTEGGFNGTPPANNRGERFNVAGGTRDGGMALYAVIPEPSSLVLIGLMSIACGAAIRRRAH